MRSAERRASSVRRGSLVGVGLAFAALSFGGIAAVACGGSGSSTGVSSSPGDTIINDTRDAEMRPPGNPSDGAAPMGEPDGYAAGQPEAGYYGDAGIGVYGSDAPSSYPGVSECNSCSCPSATGYCFGGATPRKDPMIVVPQAGAADAAPLCPMVAAGALGCTAFPAGATDCPSLLAVLQPTYLCYLDCANDGMQLTVYCPNP